MQLNCSQTQKGVQRKAEKQKHPHFHIQTASIIVNSAKTSQVTYVTMVPRVGNETLRPLGATMGNASSVTRA